MRGCDTETEGGQCVYVSRSIALLAESGDDTDGVRVQERDPDLGPGALKLHHFAGPGSFRGINRGQAVTAMGCGSRLWLQPFSASRAVMPGSDGGGGSMPRWFQTDAFSPAGPSWCPRSFKGG